MDRMDLGGAVMATEVVSRIGSDPGDDYTTLAAWYAAKKGDLVSRDTIEIAELRGETHTVGVNMQAADNTVDATHYFVIRAMDGAAFRGDLGDLTNQAVVSGAYLTSTVDYTRCYNVLVKSLSSSSVATAIALSGGACLVACCGASDINVTASGGVSGLIATGIACDGANSVVKNCIACGVAASQTSETSQKAASARGIVGATVYTSTVAHVSATNQSVDENAASTAYGINGSTAAYNCLAFSVSASGVGGDVSEAAIESPTKDYNATDDGTGGTHGITITPADEIEDTNTSTFDCHLKSGADCVGAGTDLSGSGVDEDIDGDSRPQNTTWDIGADEYTTSSPTLTGSAPSLAWALSAGSLTPGNVNASGSAPSAAWGLAAGTPALGAVQVTGAAASLSWTAASGSIVTGAVAVSGAAPALAWGVTAGLPALGGVAVAGAAPALSWGVQAGDPGLGTVSRTGEAAGLAWALQSGELTAGAVALTGAAAALAWGVTPGELAILGSLSGDAPSLDWRATAGEIVARALRGPYRVVAAEVYSPDAAQVEVYSPAAVAAEAYSPRLAAGQTYAPAMAAGQVYSPGIVAGQVV